MVAYSLTHLTQADHQRVVGPIQDDEALLLFAVVRCMVIRRVLEVGGLSGYSARNFLAAIGEAGMLYTVDINAVPRQALNQIVLTKDAGAVTAEDVGDAPLDLIFFDCHVLKAQMALLAHLDAAGLLHRRTILALHDTNVHPRQRRVNQRQAEDGWIHQLVEREMVNALHEAGWDAVMFHTAITAHGPHLPVRHGVTLMQRFQALRV
jgi:predicted O-methyltransferase YrrM